MLTARRTILALPDEVRMLVGVELVDVEQNLPVWIGIRVVGNCRATPNATYMIGVLPEVVDVAMVEASDRDAIVAVKGVEDRVIVLPVSGIRFQRRVALRIPILHPCERL